MKRVLLLFLLGLLLVGCTNTSVNIKEKNNDNSKVSKEQNKKNDSKDGSKSTEDVLYYIDKLKDEDFVSVSGDGENQKIWYTAAEELGKMGKHAIPFLIKNLDTKNDYERALTLYALLLASQDESVAEFTNGEYIDVNLDFDPKVQEGYVKVAKAWWEKYKGNWE